jgi:hypothetical protein
MLAAAGLGATWLFRKTRILAIFDDLDTVLLMIPLKIMIVGFRWQLGLIVILMVALLWLAWRYLHAWRIPMSWRYVLGYSLAIAAVSEVIYLASKVVDDVVPIHIEVLLPAFVLGCMAARPKRAGGSDHAAASAALAPHDDPGEVRAATAVSACFMVLVGLSMPTLDGLADSGDGVGPVMTWPVLAIHVLAVTVLSNLGKMFPLFCYRGEATWRERLAVSVAMFPRGEVGAGVLVISLSYGIGGPMITVAMFSLALNLLCTGLFIAWVRQLIPDLSAPEASRGSRSTGLQYADARKTSREAASSPAALLDQG